jgi:proline iminopeptidase
MTASPSPDTGLYPPIDAYKEGRLTVSALHTLYYEESGNPGGKPVVVLHGGPGAGSSPLYRQAFNPRAYRIVQFDQRGCGRSEPRGELRDNTTPHLIADIEALRTHLAIDSWQVFGGSWGGTLALAYGQTHPDRVTEFVIRGASLWRKRDFDWIYQFGAHAFHPDAWNQFVELIPTEERQDMLGAYLRRLKSDEPDVRDVAARRLGIWEMANISLRAHPEQEAAHLPLYLQGLALFEAEYAAKGGWFKHDGQLLEDMRLLRDVPAVIVYGAYDLITPPAIGWEIHRAWPEAEFVIVPEAGHAFYEPAIAGALVAATDRFAQR